MALAKGGAFGGGLGRLRDRVTLQSPTRTRATSGQVTVEWADVATVYAAVEGLTGSELYRARQVQPDVSYKVRLRWRADVTADWRIVWAGKSLDVAAVVASGGRHGELWALCSEAA